MRVAADEPAAPLVEHVERARPRVRHAAIAGGDEASSAAAEIDDRGRAHAVVAADLERPRAHVAAAQVDRREADPPALAPREAPLVADAPVLGAAAAPRADVGELAVARVVEGDEDARLRIAVGLGEAVAAPRGAAGRPHGRRRRRADPRARGDVEEEGLAEEARAAAARGAAVERDERARAVAADPLGVLAGRQPWDRPHLADRGRVGIAEVNGEPPRGRGVDEAQPRRRAALDRHVLAPPGQRGLDERAAAIEVEERRGPRSLRALAREHRDDPALADDLAERRRGAQIEGRAHARRALAGRRRRAQVALRGRGRDRQIPLPSPARRRGLGRDALVGRAVRARAAAGEAEPAGDAENTRGLPSHAPIIGHPRGDDQDELRRDRPLASPPGARQPRTRRAACARHKDAARART
ncbi:MAG: hypothetical protein R3A79_18065 [Nannocystaceae bacterium]